MTNAVKQSLEDNLDQILENLPKEFHDDFKASMEAAEPVKPLSENEAKQEAILLIRDNPTIPIIDEAECAAIIEDGEQFWPDIAEVSESDLEQQKAEMLKAAHAAVSE